LAIRSEPLTSGAAPLANAPSTVPPAPLVVFAVAVVRFAVCFAVVAVLAALGTELCLRLFTRPPFSIGYLRTHPTRHYELTPNFRGRTYDVELAINSDGMRDYERQLRPDSFKVAIFGDSITFGQGVALPDIYPKRLETLLDDAQGRRVEVLNFATPGLNTVAEASLMHDVYDRFSPQLIIFQYTLADDAVPMIESRSNRFGWVRVLKDLLRRFYAYDYLAGRYYALRNPATNTPSDGSAASAGWYGSAAPGWRECQAAFRDIATFARAHHAEVVFALVAYEGIVAPSRDRDPSRPTIAKVEAALDATGIRHHLVLDDALREYAGKEAQLMVKPGDHHLNVAGHEKLAMFLRDYLLQDGLVTKDAAVGR
jgi:hypothetical protein